MKRFMGKEFLLDTETARQLYHTYAERLPIIDYHCHVSPREIAENPPLLEHNRAVARRRSLQVARNALLRHRREVYHRRCVGL